jgi:DNA-binding transcriptional LysR family regulator
MLDTRRLKVLCEVARRGSFSAAANALGYTQPAVSRQIATLEAETGATLVRRLPQGAVLTDAGRLLVAHANAILARLDDAEAELRALRGLSGGRLRLASFASAASSVVPLAAMRFRERHPQVELSVTMAEPADSLPRLRAGELDMALSHDPWSSIDSAPGLELVHLFDDPMYIALPLGHELTDAEPLSLGVFADEPWMLSMPETCPDSRLFRRACVEAGFEPRIALENDDYSAVLGFVAAGLGVALIPEMVTRFVRADVVIRTLEPSLPPRPIIVAMPADYRTAAAAAMVAVLREVAEDWVAAREPVHTRIMAPSAMSLGFS